MAPGGFRAFCPAGSTVVGTGADPSVATIGFVLKFGSFVGGFMYNDSSISVGVQLQAICAFGPSDALASSVRSAQSGRRSYAAAVREAQALR